MNPSECPSAAELADFHSGLLGDYRLAVVAGHLDDCADCLGIPTPVSFPPIHVRLPENRFDAEAGCARARQRVARLASTGFGVGQLLGEFRLLREIGRGGMGIVYEAEQQSLGRRVAVKVVQTSGPVDPDLMRRFEREAKAVGRLHHTNIVPVFGVGEQDGAPFYAMQFIDGVGLNDLIDALARKQRGEPLRDAPSDRLVRPLTAWDAAGMIAQAAEGVGHAHDQGVLHRDIKPSNLLIDTHGMVWVTDFGLAKTDDAADLTHTGDLLGTVRYMAPEMFDGKADRRSDVYALGLTLYELLALRPAFDGSDRGQVMKAVLGSGHQPLAAVAANVPRDLETVVAKATDRDPRRRYQTAHDLAADLRRFVRDEPILARRLGPGERLGRWARHNRGLAAALAGLVVTLIGVAVGSLAAAGRFRTMAKEQTELAASEGTQRRLAQEAEDAALSNLYAAEMGVAARVAEQPTGLARLRELVDHWQHPVAGRPDPRGWEWRVFRDLARPEQFVRTDRMYDGVAWSPDGTRLAVNVDGKNEILDSADGTTVRRFPADVGRTFSLNWSADGRRLVAGTEGGVSILDAETGALVYRVPHGPGPTSAGMHPGGRLLATHADDSVVRIHDITAGRVVVELPNAVNGPPGTFGFSPDGRHLATIHKIQASSPLVGPDRGVIAIWRTADWRRVGTVLPPRNWATSVRWVDDRRLVLALFAGGASVCDAMTGAEIQPLTAERHLTEALDVSVDGRRVVTGDWGWVVWAWNPDTGRRVAVCRGHTMKVYRAVLAPDGSRVASVAHENAESALRVWNLAGRQPVRTLEPPAPVSLPLFVGLAWHPIDDRLACPSTRGRTRVYDNTDKPTAGRRGNQLTWDPTGQWSVAHDEDDIWIYAADSDEPVRTLKLRGTPKSIRWHPTDGRLAIRAGVQLWVWNPSLPDPPTLVFGDPYPPTAEPNFAGGGVAWHPDGRRIAFAAPHAESWVVHLIDPTTRTIGTTTPAKTRIIEALAWSPDGSRIAVAGDDPAINVFDATGNLIQSLRGHTFTVQDLAYSPDGTRLASAGLDGNVLLWDAASGRLLLSFEMGSPALGVAWSRDGSKLAALTDKGTVKVWDAGTSK